MDNKIKALEKAINWHLEEAERRFNGEWDKAHELRWAKIDGLISALEILTYKHYYIDGTALKVRGDEE